MPAAMTVSEFEPLESHAECLSIVLPDKLQHLALTWGTP